MKRIAFGTVSAYRIKKDYKMYADTFSLKNCSAESLILVIKDDGSLFKAVSTIAPAVRAPKKVYNK